MRLKQNLWLTMCLLLTSINVWAQVDRAFEQRASFDVNGGIEAIGNVLVTCDSSDENCDDRQAGTGNNNIDSAYVNIDSVAVNAGYDNSSSAVLDIPSGSNVLYAALYWGGRAENGTGSKNTIRIRVPNSNSYTQVTAFEVDTFSTQGSDNNRPYQAVANVTNLVTNAGEGNYFVADLTANNGDDSLGYYGGWSMVVLFENNSFPFRRLALHDGAVRVTGTTTVSVTIDDLLTPLSGAFETSVGGLVWEGDEGIDGDSFVFEGNNINKTLNPDDNFWNSSITKFNAQVTAKNPNYVNQLGMDIDVVDVSGLYGNGETDATIDFVTDGDFYYAHYLFFSTELYAPDFGTSINKSSIDLSGNQPIRNDIIEYSVSFTNDGNDSSINTVVLDEIPANMTYVSNSISIDSADVGPTGTATDASGDDFAEYDAINNEVIIRVGLGANSTNGGSLDVGESATVSFRAQINNNAPVGDITNTASVSSNSAQLPNNDFIYLDSDTITINDIIPPNAASCSVSPNPANEDTAITATCTGVETNGSVSIPGYTCGNESGGTVVCTATAGTDSGEVSGDATATTFDADGNSATSNVPFVLDITPPSIGTCNVSPDPAMTGVAVQALCSGVETGAVLTIPGYTCNDNGSGNWTCDGIAGQNGVDGTEQATATDSAGNTTSTPATFTLDDMPPSPAACTVEPNPANDNTPLVATCTGVEAGGSVSIPNYTCGTENNGIVLCNGTAGAGGVTGDETATSSDAAGNTSTSTAAFTLDNDAPAAAACSVDPSTAANGTNLIVTCTGVETDGSVELPGYICGEEDNGSVICTGVAGPGNITGDVTGTTADTAGNTTPTTALFTLDNTAPDAPVVSPVLTNDVTPVISGTAEGDSTVTVIVGGATYTVMADSNGNWTLDLGNQAPDSGTLNLDLNGANDVTATATDTAGNTSPVDVTSGELVIDTTAPTAPTIDPLTELTSPVTGLAEPGATITLTGVVCTNEPIVADANGVWSCDNQDPLTSGDVIGATATDAAGNVSQPASSTVGNSATDSVSPTINPVADGADVISGTAIAGSTIDLVGIMCDNSPVVADVNGIWSCTNPDPSPVTGDVITATATQDGLDPSPAVTTTVFNPNVTAPGAPQVDPTDGDPVTGTTIPNGEITVLDDEGNVICTTIADNDGNFVCSPVNPLPDDGDVITVIVTDENNNDSLPTQVTVDSSAPDAPVVSSISTDSGLSDSDGITSDNTLVINGMAEPFSTVEVFVDGLAVGTAPVDENGMWVFDFTGTILADDDYIITARATDASNNTSIASDSFDVTVDTSGPVAPSVDGISSDTGASDSDGITNDNTLTFNGLAEPGSIVEVFINGVSIGTTLANNNGEWIFDHTGTTLLDGSYEITAQASDFAGTTGPLSSVFDVVVDTMAQNAPTCSVTPNPANNGTIVTASCEVVEADGVVTIPGYVCGLVNAQGVVDCTATVGEQGVNGDESATITDVAGNNVQTPATFVLDNDAPAVPVITSPVNGSTINDNLPVIQGTGENGSIITVTGPDGQSCSTVVANGTWSCTLDAPLADNANLISATAADALGNTSGEDSVTVNVRPGKGFDLVIDDNSELITTEMGGTDSFTAVLPLTPSADVTVNFTSSDTTEGTVSPSSHTFTTANWNQPVTVTVTGVDDTVYDLDTDYQVIIGTLSSTDTDYNGVDPADIDAVNIDDDEMPDLSAFITNCVAGVNPTDSMLYQLTVSNPGNKDIEGAIVTATFDDTMSAPNWTCEGIECGTTSGSGDLNESIDLSSGASVTYLFDANVTGQLLDFIDVTAGVTMPDGETDIDLSNNDSEDSDLIYQFIFKEGFDCAASGTIGSTTDFLESLID